jgi:hypothetical protein
VAAATSERPLSTFDTVGIDTPACAAMSAMVVRGDIGSLLVLTCPVGGHSLVAEHFGS